MKKNILNLAVVVFAAILLWLGVLSAKNLRERELVPTALAPQFKTENTSFQSAATQNNQTENIAPGENMTNFPLKLPSGFRISVFAENLSGARVMLFDSLGNMWVSRSSANVVTLLEIQDGKVASQKDVLTGLRKPHGLALDPDDPFLMYVGEEDKIMKTRIYAEGNYEKIADLPFGAGHSTRTLLFAPDKKLFVSIGSSCNVCEEKDARRASIYSLNVDGSDFKQFATGLRNSVFMTLNPKTQEIWATEMGRDLLGDDIPPEEINIIREGKNYGWPYCFDKQKHDSSFDPSGNKKEFCQTTETPQIEIQAHSAPLGLAFLKNSNLPTEYRDNLLVSYHGSWNRSVPTGYKVVRHKFDEQGNYLGVEDFITGWLQKGKALGRPVGILESADGKIFISDDEAGVIYLVEHVK